MRLHHQSHNRCGLKHIARRHYGIEVDVIAVERPTSGGIYNFVTKRGAIGAAGQRLMSSANEESPGFICGETNLWTAGG
jgi:hypothetical protein